MNPVLHHCFTSTTGQEGWQYSLKFNNSKFMSIKSLHPLSFHCKTMPLSYYTQWWCLTVLNMRGSQWTDTTAGPCEPNNIGYHCVLGLCFIINQTVPTLHLYSLSDGKVARPWKRLLELTFNFLDTMRIRALSVPLFDSSCASHPHKDRTTTCTERVDNLTGSL